MKTSLVTNIIQIRNLLTAFILLLTSSVHSQTFNKVYDFQDREFDNWGRNIEESDSGFVIFQIGVEMVDQIENRLGFLKIDANGNQVLDIEHGTEGYHNWIGWANSGHRTEDDTYILGATTVHLDDITDERHDAFFMEFDAMGDTIQTYQLQDTLYYASHSVKQTPDGGYILVGQTDDTQSGDLGAFLLKLSPEAELDWLQSYEDGGDNIVGLSVINSYESGFILSGGVRDMSSFDICENLDWDYDMLIIKTNNQGDEIWRKTFGTCRQETEAHLALTSDGNYIFSGAIKIDTISNLGNYLMKPYVVKFDPEGDTLWTNTYGIWNFECVLTKIEELDDGSFISGGFTYADDELVPHRWGNLIKIAADGEEIWNRNYKWADNNQCLFRDVIQTSDGGFIACGRTWPSELNVSTDTWVVKTDSMGCIVPGCHVGVEELQVQQTYFLAGPNPVSEILNIYMSELAPLSNTLVFELRDMQGKILKSFEADIPGTTFMLPVVGLSSGTYILSLSDGGRILQTERIVKN